MPLFFVKGWILVSTWASLAGWSLSLSGHFNQTSYTWSLVFLAFALALLCGKTKSLRSKAFFYPICYLKRLRENPFNPCSWLPLLFIFVAFLALAGGILYTPSNYDALSYRLPRILHWLDTGHWRWIDTPNTRQNYSAPGFEWLMAPLLVFFKTDRLFFLINWISFLLLPSLLFRTFRLAGIPANSCWWWMWLFPLGYGYVLQSGSIGNDAFATVYALASVCFVLSADKRERFSDFGWSFLAIGLLTGTKGTNLPLALPWFAAMLLRYQVWLSHVPKLMPSIAMALMISFVPTAALNHKHTGSWSGDPTNQGKMNLSNPCAGFAGNSLIFAYSAVQPPVLPASSRVNDFVTHLLPSQFKVWLVARFPRFELKMGEIPMEETAGLGLGFIACFVLWIFKGRRSPVPLAILQGQPWFSLGIAGLISLLFFMAKMGSESTARLLLPYYPFLLLLPLGFWSLASGTLRKLAPLFTLLCSTALVGLFLCPARPLFPIQKFLTLIGDNPRFARVSSVYQTYIQRGTCWKPILTIVPPDIKTLGFFSHGDDLEAPLWRPFGLRRIVSTGEKDITVSGLPHADAWLARRPIAEFLKANPEWQIHWKEIGAQLIAQKASVGVEEWAVFLPR
jgi:hypothetical protein